MDIDKLILIDEIEFPLNGFSSLMDIDKLIRVMVTRRASVRFSSLMDIDKLIQFGQFLHSISVLVL